MYKAVYVALLVASIAYILTILPFQLSTPDLDSDTQMALTSISRSVARKILAVETPEVCLDTCVP